MGIRGGSPDLQAGAGAQIGKRMVVIECFYLDGRAHIVCLQFA